MSSSTIFISYARKDGLERARRLDTDLVRHGFATWRDLRNLNPNLDFTAELETAISRSSRVVCCVTPDVKRSDSFVRREIGYALVLGKPVVPLIFEGCVPPISIINVTWEDFTHTPWDEAMSRLVYRLGRDEKNPDSIDPFEQYLKDFYKVLVSLLHQLVFTEIELHVNMIASDGQAANPFEALSSSFMRQRYPTTGDTPLTQALTLRQAFSKAGQRLMLLGDPGAGKTISLLALARDLVAERLEDPNRPLPILDSISTWNPATPKLSSWLSSRNPKLSEETIEQLIQRNEAVLVLDGLDELSAHQELGSHGIVDSRKLFLDQLPHQGQLLVSSRTADWRNLQQKSGLFSGTAHLRRFDDNQLDDYLSSLPMLRNALEADHQLKDLARTPLFLSIIRYAYSDVDDGIDLHLGLDQSLGSVQEIIFDRYVSLRIEHEQARNPVHSMFSEEQLYDILGQVAFSQAPDDPVTSNLQNSSISDKVAALAGSIASELLEFGIVLQLLVRNEQGRVQFSHMLLRRHFGRKTCLQRWNYKTSLPDYVWTGESQEFLRAMAKLAWFGDEREVNILIKTTEHKEAQVRAHAAMALGGIGHSKAADTLCRLLADEHKWHREAAVCDIACWALIQMGESALPALSGLIESGADTHMSTLVLLVLSRISNDSAQKIVETLTGDHRKVDRSSESELVGYYVRNTTLAELAKEILHRAQENLPLIYDNAPFLRLPGSKPWTMYD